jgi:uncharacterized protein (DUF952 family)
MTTNATSDWVYKIMPNSAWAAAVACGTYTGSPDDVRDGFIHLSARHQIEHTADKYFVGVPGLVLIAIAPATLEGALRWERSRGGDLFPHLFGDLPVGCAIWVRPLALGADGRVRVVETLAAD